MSGITLAQAQAQLDAWLAASLAVAEGQSYMINGNTYTRVNAEHIDKMIFLWEGRVERLSSDSAAVGRTYAKNGGGGRW